MGDRGRYKIGEREAGRVKRRVKEKGEQKWACRVKGGGAEGGKGEEEENPRKKKRKKKKHIKTGILSGICECTKAEWNLKKVTCIMALRGILLG